METVMAGSVFMTMAGVHLHPVHHPCAYCYHSMLQQHQENIIYSEISFIHHQQQENKRYREVNFMLQQLQQQEENMIYREKMPKKFIWKFPGFGMLKLNTDGSSKGNPGPSSFGGLIRDCEGRWLCGYMGKMEGRSFNSLEAELVGIIQGLRLVQRKNLTNMLIETDCLAAISLGVKGVRKDHPLKPILDAIEAILISQRCTMIHTRRDGNHSADMLAKLGGHQSAGYVELEEPPASLIPYLLRDKEAATEFEWNSRNH